MFFSNFLYLILRINSIKYFFVKLIFKNKFENAIYNEYKTHFSNFCVKFMFKEKAPYGRQERLFINFLVNCISKANTSMDDNL